MSETPTPRPGSNLQDMESEFAARLEDVKPVFDELNGQLAANEVAVTGQEFDAGAPVHTAETTGRELLKVRSGFESAIGTVLERVKPGKDGWKTLDYKARGADGKPVEVTLMKAPPYNSMPDYRLYRVITTEKRRLGDITFNGKPYATRQRQYDYGMDSTIPHIPNGFKAEPTLFSTYESGPGGKADHLQEDFSEIESLQALTALIEQSPSKPKILGRRLLDFATKGFHGKPSLEI